MLEWKLHVEVEARAPQPPALLFDVVMDFENAPKRFRWITRVEKYTPGPVRVGTELIQFMSFYGMRKRALITIDALEAPNLCALSVNDGTRTHRQSVRFDARDDGTAIKVVADSGFGLLGALVMPFTKKSAMLRCEDYIHDLVAAAETIEGGGQATAG